MKMEKKMWSTPVANVEQFMANEYVAQTCYNLGCAIPGEDGSGYDFNYRHHTAKNDGTGCGHKDNQVLVETVYDVNGVDQYRYTMKEVNTDGWGDLNCTFYTGNGDDEVTREDYSEQYRVPYWTSDTLGEKLKAGMQVFWTTIVGSGIWATTMYHWGVVEYESASNPNRS